jgi:Family of unknown function (DUF6445)
MESQVVIVDGFYKNPDAVREIALSSEYRNIIPTDYPGYASQKIVIVQSITDVFSELLDRDLNLDPARFTWGGFRFITEESGSNPVVHADQAIEWAGMVYLTPGAPMAAGTALYRHCATGFTGPPTDAQARALGFSDSSEFDEEVIKADKQDINKWDFIGYISPVYNRLMLFRGGECYHAPMAGCGDSPQTARLTHNFFFNVMSDASYAPVRLHAEVPAGKRLYEKK